MVEVPIQYEVIKTDDGQVLYRWDKDGFGKAFVGTAMMSILKNLSPAPEAASPPSEGSATAPVTAQEDGRPPEPSEATPSNDQTAAAPAAKEARQSIDGPAEVSRWHDEVTDEINAQASNFNIEGSGTVSLGFEVSANGLISRIKVLQSSGNADLDATAVRMTERAKHVRPPPGGQATSFAMKLSFL